MQKSTLLMLSINVFHFTPNMCYKEKRDIRISHQKAVHNWDFGFTGKWLKDKLSLTFEAHRYFR